MGGNIDGTLHRPYLRQAHAHRKQAHSGIEDSLQAVALPYHPEPHQQHLGRILEFRKLDYFEH